MTVLFKLKKTVGHTLYIIEVHTLSFKWLYKNVASRIYKCIVLNSSVYRAQKYLDKQKTIAHMTGCQYLQTFICFYNHVEYFILCWICICQQSHQQQTVLTCSIDAHVITLLSFCLTPDVVSFRPPAILYHCTNCFSSGIIDCIPKHITLLQLFFIFCRANMDASEEQNTGTANGTSQTSGNSRTPQIAHMSLYERQAVQVGVVI